MMKPVTQHPMSPRTQLTRDDIHAALKAVAAGLERRGLSGELCLFGGSVMVLVYAARVATKDVDALFQPASAIREIAAQVAAAQSLPDDWLNDGVKGYLSARHEVTADELPQFPSLKLTMPVPEYLLAMKCLAARLGGAAGEPSDVEDIRTLINELRIKTSGEVLDLVSRYYPAGRIPVKTQYLEGMFEEGTP